MHSINKGGQWRSCDFHRLATEVACGRLCDEAGGLRVAIERASELLRS